MNFLYPQLLFGLFALAIPIIIHLFNFRRTKKVYFSNTAFLKKVKEASSSKVKIKHFLILASRLLFITFLVCAFAQPYLDNQKNTRLTDKVVVYLDNSYSMSNESVNGTATFDAAIGYIYSLLEVYPPATTFRLITNDFLPFSMAYKSASEIEEELTRLRLSGMSRTYNEVTSRINSELEQDSIDVFWISDFQASTMGVHEVTLQPNLSTNLVPIPFATDQNIYIDSVFVDNPFLIGNRQLKLNVVVGNVGSEDATDIGIKVYLDEVQAATATINVQAGSQETIAFDLQFSNDSLRKGRVSIEEYPVTFDNDFYFILSSSKKIEVLEIRDTDSPNYISNVFGNKALFNLQSFDVSNIDYSLINSVDLVVVNQISQPSTALVNSLVKRKTANKNILFIPSSDLVLDAYRTLLPNVRLLEEEELITFATPDFDDPFFSNVFEEKNNRFAMPEAKAVLDLGIDRTAILSLQNGRPYLSNRGSGLFALASPLEPTFATFQNHALFVPVMYKLAATSVRDFSRLYYHIDDQFIELATDTLIADNVYHIVNEEADIIPSQRNTSGQVLMELPSDQLEVGFYDVQLDGNQVNTVAFNSFDKESSLEQLATENYSEYFGENFDILEATNPTVFKSELQTKYEGIPLWKYAILLALLFLLAEVLLIRFFP